MLFYPLVSCIPVAQNITPSPNPSVTSTPFISPTSIVTPQSITVLPSVPTPIPTLLNNQTPFPDNPVSTNVAYLSKIVGKVYSIQGEPLDGVVVSIKLIDPPNYPFYTENQITASNGGYVFRQIPVYYRDNAENPINGIFEITASKEGYKTKSRLTEVIKNSFIDYEVNFGGTKEDDKLYGLEKL